jgi:hypothetical protein
MSQEYEVEANVYHIRVQEGSILMDKLAERDVYHPECEVPAVTKISGKGDRPGEITRILNRLWDLNLTLISVNEWNDVRRSKSMNAVITKEFILDLVDSRATLETVGGKGARWHD